MANLSNYTKFLQLRNIEIVWKCVRAFNLSDLMEVEIHPGDEYLGSLEPQNLQVLVRSQRLYQNRAWGCMIRINL